MQAPPPQARRPPPAAGMEGSLQKQRSSVLAGRSERYFRQQNYRLHYYIKATDQKPKATLDLRQCISIEQPVHIKNHASAACWPIYQF